MSHTDEVHTAAASSGEPERITDDPQWVFVGGLHRSGTSLVAGLLAASAEAAGLVETGVMEDEGHYLHDVVPSVYEFGGPGKFAFDARSHLGPSETPELDRARLEAAWEPFWSRPEAPVRVEKSPQNLVQTRWLQSIFPGCRQVIVTRHPAAVSLATMKWTHRGPRGFRRLGPPLSMQHLFGHWLRAHEIFEHDSAHVDDVQVVRFEDMVSLDPAARDTLFTSLGLTAGPRREFRRRPSEYEPRWRGWLESRAGRRARSTWLPAVEESMAAWGYAIDDPIV